MSGCVQGETSALEARHVAYSYVRSTSVLDDVSALVAPGSFLAILGVNGCGKSTLLSCMDDLLHPQAGAVMLDDCALSSVDRATRAQKIALVAQRSAANRLTVYDAVLLGRMPYIKGAPSEHDHRIVEEVLDELGLSSFALRYTDELSGGEYQKVVLARAFAQRSDVLLLDEPTNNLDPANQQDVMKAVRRAVDERGIAAAAVLHDVNLALRYCDRFLLLRDGIVEVQGGPEVMTEAAIERVYDMEVDIIEHKGCNLRQYR